MELDPMSVPMLTLDVRQFLRDGGEPFAEIMKAVSSLAPGLGLRLLATFRPVPLFAVMAKRGFEHNERELSEGNWAVLFTPRRWEGRGVGKAGVRTCRFRRSA